MKNFKKYGMLCLLASCTCLCGNYTMQDFNSLNETIDKKKARAIFEDVVSDKNISDIDSMKIKMMIEDFGLANLVLSKITKDNIAKIKYLVMKTLLDAQESLVISYVLALIKQNPLLLNDINITVLEYFLAKNGQNADKLVSLITKNNVSSLSPAVLRALFNASSLVQPKVVNLFTVDNIELIDPTVLDYLRKNSDEFTSKIRQLQEALELKQENEQRVAKGKKPTLKERANTFLNSLSVNGSKK